MKVTILRITHKHGVNYYIHLTREAARQELVKWVKEWWPKELPNEPMPEDEQELIDTYFELGPPDESWEMTPDEEVVGLPKPNRWIRPRQSVRDHIRHQAYGRRWSRHRPRRIEKYRRSRPRRSRR